MADPNGPDDNQAKHDKADRQNNDQNGGPKSNSMQGPATQDRDRNATPERNDRDANAPPNNIMKVRPATTITATSRRRWYTRRSIAPKC